MRNFSKYLLAVLLALLITGCAQAAVPELSLNSHPRHVVLSWTDDPTTTQTLTWQTEAAVNTQIRYYEKQGLSVAASGKTVGAIMSEIPTNKGVRYLHTVTLQGLKPGWRYEYQVGDGSAWSEPRQFKTAPADGRPFQFLIFGDSQSINYASWQTTLHKAFARHSGAAFFVNVGDLVDVGQDYSQWAAWLAAADGVIDRIPAMPISGNHESYTPQRRFSPPDLYKALFALPLNGPQGLEEQAYSFDYGDVHFVMLDSQAGEQKQFFPDLLERQKLWLDNDLAQTNQRWKIVFVHRPPYDNKSFRDNLQVREAFTPLFDKHQVDIVFTGHDHVYARTFPLRGGQAAIPGTVYVASGRSGTKTYRMASANPLNEFFYNPLDEPTYLHVEVAADTIKVKAVKQSGELIDAWALRKPAALRQANWVSSSLCRRAAPFVFLRH